MPSRSMTIHILGISAYYHDSAVVLLRDGQIVAAVQEERFSRKKHDPGFPAEGARYCLAEAGIDLAAVDCVVFYDKPLITFERLLETYLSYAPRGFRSFAAAMPVWLKQKLFLKKTLARELSALPGGEAGALPLLLFNDHHRSHAASAFYPSPFQKAAVLCLDGVGEWATTSVWSGEGAALTPLWQIDFPHSLGLLYSAFTAYAGFKVNSGEYKLMGLAPYGTPRFAARILDNLMDLKSDGTFRLNMRFFNFATGLTMTNRHFESLFGGPPRQPEGPIGQREMDIAASIQQVTEAVVLRLGRTIHAETGAKNLCLAGGVALNCVANGRLLREGPFEDIWIQPAAGDAGGALGAALSCWHDYLHKGRAEPRGDGMRGSFLGPLYSEAQAIRYLDSVKASYHHLEDVHLFERLASLLADGRVVGWHAGRMEFGPRALGARSILGDPRSPKMQSLMNRKIKYRESFRPFAPAVRAEEVADYFDLDRASPYMLIVAPLKASVRLALTTGQEALSGFDRLNTPRSLLPAVTHVDYSARIQTVHEETNPRFHALLGAFKALTGCPVLVNTSFNVRGEPIVCSPEHAYACFMRTEMDYLVVGNLLLDKREQPERQADDAWQAAFALD
jgi:carbamoyltransferase